MDEIHTKIKTIVATVLQLMLPCTVLTQQSGNANNSLSFQLEISPKQIIHTTISAVQGQAPWVPAGQFLLHIKHLVAPGSWASLYPLASRQEWDLFYPVCWPAHSSPYSCVRKTREETVCVPRLLISPIYWLTSQYLLLEDPGIPGGLCDSYVLPVSKKNPTPIPEPIFRSVCGKNEVKSCNISWVFHSILES